MKKLMGAFEKRKAKLKRKGASANFDELSEDSDDAQEKDAGQTAKTTQHSDSDIDKDDERHRKNKANKKDRKQEGAERARNGQNLVMMPKLKPVEQVTENEHTMNELFALDGGQNMKIKDSGS